MDTETVTWRNRISLHRQKQGLRNENESITGKIMPEVRTFYKEVKDLRGDIEPYEGEENLIDRFNEWLETFTKRMGLESDFMDAVMNPGTGIDRAFHSLKIAGTYREIGILMVEWNMKERDNHFLKSIRHIDMTKTVEGVGIWN